MKLKKTYTWCAAALLLASCGQEEQSSTPTTTEETAATPAEQPETTVTPEAPVATETTATEEETPASTDENAAEETTTDDDGVKTRGMKVKKSDTPGEVEETVPAAAEEEEPEPEDEEEEAAPELPTTVLVRADNAHWVRKNEPKPTSSAVITQPKYGIHYRETAARATETISYGDEDVLVSAYTTEDYSGDYYYSFWDSRTGDLVGRFRLNDDAHHSYKYPMKQDDGTYAMVSHTYEGRNLYSDEKDIIHIHPHELRTTKKRCLITERSDYEKYYIAYATKEGGSLAGPSADDPEKIATGKRLAESASTADGLGVSFSWPYPGEGMCLLVWEPLHIRTISSGSVLTCYTAQKKLYTIDLASLTVTQNSYPGYSANDEGICILNSINVSEYSYPSQYNDFNYYDVAAETEPISTRKGLVQSYFKSTKTDVSEVYAINHGEGSFVLFTHWVSDEGDIYDGHIGILKDGKGFYLGEKRLLNASQTGRLDWAGCTLLEIVEESEEEATLLLGGNEELSEFLGVRMVKVNFTTNSVQVGKKWDCVKSGLKPLWLGKMNLLLLPASEQHYRIVRVNEDNSSDEVGNLYLTHDAGYAIVLPNGHYAGSPGCESILNYGDGTRVVGLQTLAPWRNRPAEVLEALGGNADDIAALQATTERWLKKQGFDPNNMPKEPALGYFPHAEVDLPELYAESKDLSFNVRLHATRNDIVKLEVRANGVLIPQDGIGEAPVTVGERHVTVQLPLAVGQNWIEVTPVDSEGIAGATTRFRTIYKGEEESDLYVVAIGVSDYDDDDLDLQFAAKDAQDIINTVETTTTGNKHTLLLKDKEMSGKADLEKVRAFLADAKEDDRVILYIAGHGMLDSKLEYHFAPAGFNPARVRSTGISMKALTDTLQSTRARHRLLLLDTCHSGSVGESDADKLAAAGVALPPGVRAVSTRGMKVKKTESKLTDTQTKRYMEDMFAGSPEYRGINIVAASAGAEFAMESGEWNNGVFSYAIMKTLNDAEGADINGNKVLSVAELQLGVQSQVLELTRGAQRPAAVALDNGDMELNNFKPELPEVATESKPVITAEMSEDDKMELYSYISAYSKTRFSNGTDELYRKRLVAVLTHIVNGGDINTNVDTLIKKSNGTTALHNACGLGVYELVELLLRNGADANARATNGVTPEQCVGDDNDPNGRIRALLRQYK